MSNNAARTVGTVGIWLSVAIIMAFGLCRMNWSGDSAEITFLLAIVIVCGAAVGSTAFVWMSPAQPELPARYSDGTSDQYAMRPE